MGIITLILSIITALPKIIALVVEIIGLFRGLKKDDPTYTLSEQFADEAELKLAVKAYKETNDAGPLRRLHERIRARRMRRNA
jgi:choline-glycine betaine transporter